MNFPFDWDPAMSLKSICIVRYQSIVQRRGVVWQEVFLTNVLKRNEVDRIEKILHALRLNLKCLDLVLQTMLPCRALSMYAGYTARGYHCALFKSAER